MVEIIVTLSSWVSGLIEKHGGVRPASRALQIDPSYLMRLRDGEKFQPSKKVLRHLGLKQHITYTVEDR